MKIQSLERLFDILSGVCPLPALTKKEKNNLKAARSILLELAKEKDIYGVNTGVGALLGRRIPAEEQEEFQKRLICSHACGTAKALDKEITRLVLLLLISGLRKGYSGISLETLKFLMKMFNLDLIPIVPEVGSVGASGDLVPMAHLALPLIGRGFVWDYIPLAGVVARPWVSPKLGAGEAIALLNGTYFSTAVLAFVVNEAKKLIEIAEMAAVMSMEALGGKKEAWSKEVNDLKLHQGQRVSAEKLRGYVSGGGNKNKNVQDGYSLRCVPQVHGAVRDAIGFCERIVLEEINSVSCNPVVFTDSREVRCGGNFHGQSISMAADLLAIALATLANISERRINRLLNSALSGLPAFLSQSPSHSGLMIAQYTAVALASKNKVLAHPASVDSIPLSADQEDFVSMSAAAALKAKEVFENTRWVLATEILCAVQAMDFLKDQGLENNSSVWEFYRKVRGRVLHYADDKELSSEIGEVVRLINSW